MVAFLGIRIVGAAGDATSRERDARGSCREVPGALLGVSVSGSIFGSIPAETEASHSLFKTP